MSNERHQDQWIMMRLPVLALVSAAVLTVVLMSIVLFESPLQVRHCSPKLCLLS